MRLRSTATALVATASLVLAAGAAAAASTPTTSDPQVISDDALKAESVTMGGAAVLPTTKTVPHWHGATTDPNNHVTYGYNMVGADPLACSGSACDVTVQVDITPINVEIGGRTFKGSEVVQPTLDSPQFATNGYGTTLAATTDTNSSGAALPKGPGGALSQDDAGVPLQLQDATMRAQFDQTGSSPYHVRLQPNVKPAVTITVPSNHGVLRQSARGVVFANVDISWWSSQITRLETSADPTHLPLYLTDDVLLYIGSPSSCCVIGYHGTVAAGNRLGTGKTQGNAPVQTFAWASYVSPGLYSRPDGGTYWALQDIHAISHEIAEWADDPFVNNTVEPWLTPTAPQYGCTSVLETGDPVVAIGFAMGTNTFRQGPNPNGTQSADGAYHPEDEALFPWFLRLPADEAGSEPTQGGSGGRYTFMGDLNPFPGFRQAATGC